MVKNYFKIAIRQLLKNKTFSIINISGLAIGMAAVILILIWVKNEVTYDRFHADKERIYELWNKGTWSGQLQCWRTTPKVAANFLKSDLPEVDKVSRLSWSSINLFNYADKKIKSHGCEVDPEFLDIFSFPLVLGTKASLLKTPNSIVITEKLAKKIFNEENPVGKTIRGNNADDFMVTGVLKDLPTNTRFNFEYLLPWSFLISKEGDEQNWGNNSVTNYVKLKENTNLSNVQKKVAGLRKKHQKDYDGIDMFLYPLERWRLHSNFENGVERGGKIEMVRLFIIISGFILLIACINFMNLSTARSERRAKEVGIRKTVGAIKSSLVKQFLGESILLVFFAFLIAILLVQLFMPAFNQLIMKRLSIDYGNVYFWIASVIFILFTGCLAGFYPAFFLSSFKPVSVLKGTYKATNTLITPRKILVVAQFSFAIILIVCTIIVKQQISYVQKRDAGYQRENLLYHFLTPDLEKNYSALKTELIARNLVTSVCKTSAPITEGWSDSWGFEWEGKDPNDKTDFDRYCVDADFIKTAGLTLLTGRDLNLKEHPSDSSAMLINESALKVMKFKDPIGQIVKDGDSKWHIVGVFKDFILNSPYYPTKPMIVNGAKGWFATLHLRLKAGSTNSDLKKIETVFKKYNPQFPFEYSFVNEEYATKFADEERTSIFAMVFAGLTIFISCLGLFGLATYMAENRIKEIGIRKVLGASVANITSLLAINFLKLVIISIFIATPLAWWFMHDWLGDYPYHVSIHWWVFIVAGISSILIALVTVSFQSIKAALANPIKNLRTE